MSPPLLRLVLVGALVAPSLATPPPDDEDVAELQRKYDALSADFTELRALYDELHALYTASQEKDAMLESQLDFLRRQLSASTAPSTEFRDDFFIPRQAIEFEESGQPQFFGNIYTKPYLTGFGDNIYIGGYFDLEYRDPDGDGDNTFDQHRIVPLIYADVSDRVKFSSEIELEHGNETFVEFAQVDYLFCDQFNLRGGIMLLPLGKLNFVHDSPIQDLTDRPLLNRYIIPTTLSDAGVGAWGDLTDTVSYDLTITNGFKGLADDGTVAISNESGLRDARPKSDDIGKVFRDINDDVAYTGRVAWRPHLGVELGGSMHHGKYDEGDNNELSIYALDAAIDGKAFGCMPDQLELLGEAAYADIDRDGFAEASGVPGDMDGYYVQANWHCEPDFLAGWKESGAVEDDAHFTWVLRHGVVDLDDYEMDRTTVGLNFRPNATRTVFKLDYQFNDDSGANAGSNDNDAFLFSIATYF